MRRTFNLGLGLIVLADPRGADRLCEILKKKKEKPIIIGEVIKE
jgi:phosphoribosylaminoimidazole (AIR) synthetase